MYIVVETEEVDADGRRYVESWYIGLKSTDKLGDRAHRFKAKEVHSNLYLDPHRWYLNTNNELRKNPHRILRILK